MLTSSGQDRNMLNKVNSKLATQQQKKHHRSNQAE